MLTDYLNQNTIALNQEARDRDDAIRIAGELLVKQSLVKEQYIDEMIRTVDEMGAYMVISPGIAFAHARPSDLVNEDSTSMVTLKTPVEFGHKQNDPVVVLFALAGKESTGHLSIMKDISRLIIRESFMTTIISAGSVDEVIAYISSKEGG